MFQSFELTADKGATPDRVAALRAAMAEAGVTGFLVPRADAHQGENVAPRDERLAWLTGFTGSAGIAVVMAERAALFVDGRYTLQASDQVVTDIFEIVPMHETPVHKWLETALPQNGKLAYDPWLHGKTQIDQIRKVAKTSGTALISLNENLIDKVWTDQPPAPAGAVRIHGFDVAGEDNAAKRSRIGAVVADKGASQAVLTLPDSIAWLLNIRGSDIARSPVAHGFAIAKADGHVDLFMDPDKLDGTVREHLGNTVSIHGPDALAAALGALEGPVLLDQTSCPLWVAEQMAETGQELIWGEDPCIQPKAAKNASEIAGMHAAHQRDGTAMIRFLCWLDGAIAAGETLTEIDIVTRLEGFRAAAGDLSDISFDTIAGSGPNGAIVHYRVNRDSNRALVPGELLLVDSGGQYPDGTTDITRTMPTGPVTDAQRKHFTLVLKGMIGLSRIRWPKGLNGRDLDPLARAALWRAGLDYD
ncbi:MAG: aminopeptidase P family N-terminal domain-containing protein, partial [Pseudomonadota bacterium]